MHFLLLPAGLILLVLGAEALVRGAAKLAAAAGVSPLVIGLTVVAYGTSAPEMVVSVMSGYAGQADLAVGNVVGSNIFNILFILGISALIAPLVVSRQLIRLDVPLMIGVSFLTPLLGFDGKIGRADGILLFAGALAYTLFLIRLSRRECGAVVDEFAAEYGATAVTAPRAWILNVGLVAAGLGLLVAGSRWLVAGAVSIAQSFGVSELVIGLTIIAAGTSLPEVATSIVAALRGERDIAVGNVVGSNLFNILAVLGISGIAAPEGIVVSETALGFDIPVMIAVALSCLPIFVTGHVISRWEGALFLGYYFAYTTYIVLAATGHSALPVFTNAMVGFVIPLTVVTLSVISIRYARSKNRSVK